MTKGEFLCCLRDGLNGLPPQDVEERVAFYGEMIDDRMEDGLTEEEAVAEIGTVDEITAQIIADTPLLKLVKEKIKPNRTLKAWEIVLLVLGAPVWGSLLIAAFAVLLSICAALWSVIVAVWASFAAVVGAAFGGIVGGIGLALGGYTLTGLALIGAGLVCAGLSVFLCFASRAATKGTARLTKAIAVSMKRGFTGKEKAA